MEQPTELQKIHPMVTIKCMASPEILFLCLQRECCGAAPALVGIEARGQEMDQSSPCPPAGTQPCHFGCAPSACSFRAARTLAL